MQARDSRRRSEAQRPGTERIVSSADDGGGKNNERSGIGGRTADSERVGEIIEGGKKEEEEEEDEKVVERKRWRSGSGSRGGK